ncbi:MAG: MerR family transcriptional regulator [Desulfobacteraceae bacterium]
MNRTLTIHQVSQKARIPKHTLRFWEKALDGVLVPLRTKGGQRRYTSEHLLLLEEVKHLKRKGLSLAEIRTELTTNHRSLSDPSTLDLLAEHITEAVRITLHRFFTGGSS